MVKEDVLLPFFYEEMSTSGEKPLKTMARSQRILETGVKSLNRVYIIVDGLDECVAGGNGPLISWFKKVASAISDSGQYMRCLFLSQSDEEASRLFKGVPTIMINSSHLEADIKTFCEVESQKIMAKFALQEVERDQIVERVRREAHGTHITNII